MGPEEDSEQISLKEMVKNSLRVPGGTAGGTSLTPGKGSREQTVPEGYEGLGVPALHSSLMSLGLAWPLAWLGAAQTG